MQTATMTTTLSPPVPLQGVDAGAGREWRRFSPTEPGPESLVEIRRAHDNKTILRRRSDLAPSFSFDEAFWRPI